MLLAPAAPQDSFPVISVPAHTRATTLHEQIAHHAETITQGVQARAQRQKQISELTSVIEIRTRSLGFIGRVLGFSGIGEQFYTSYDQLAKDRAELRKLSTEQPKEEHELRAAQHHLITITTAHLKSSSRIFAMNLDRLEELREVESACQELGSRARAVSQMLHTTDSVLSIKGITTRIPSTQSAATIIQSVHREISEISAHCEELKAAYPDLGPVIRPALRAFGLIKEHLFGSKQNEWNLREGLNPCNGKAAGQIIGDALTVLAQRATNSIVRIRNQTLGDLQQHLVSVLQEHGISAEQPFSIADLAAAYGFERAAT